MVLPLAHCAPWRLGSETINFVALLPSCGCIETAFNQKDPMGFISPEWELDAEGAACRPCVGGLCPLTQQVTSLYILNS